MLRGREALEDESAKEHQDPTDDGGRARHGPEHPPPPRATRRSIFRRHGCRRDAVGAHGANARLPRCFPG